MNSTILIIDDEPQIRRVLRNALSPEAKIVEAASGREGIDLAAAERPAMIVLDLGLPDLPGISVCTEIRRWSEEPILVLSARYADSEKVALLDAGADDYVTKPFSTAEVRARVRALLRRAARSQEAADYLPWQSDGLTIDVARRTVSRDDRPVHLTPTEWDLLRAFVRNAGRTLTHRQIFSEVWGRAAGDAQAYLRVHIANLRRKIERDSIQPTLIVTEPGVGYRLESDP
jgi:two-component system, OmpR family, KDP operon response regulator KdpE